MVKRWPVGHCALLCLTFLTVLLQKIQAGRLLLCEVEVESMEGRKLWMKATVRDGPQGKVYATARALFVAPKTQRLIRDGVKLALHKLFPSSASVE